MANNTENILETVDLSKFTKKLRKEDDLFDFFMILLKNEGNVAINTNRLKNWITTCEKVLNKHFDQDDQESTSTKNLNHVIKNMVGFEVSVRTLTSNKPVHNYFWNTSELVNMVIIEKV